uniref:Uncharacterized protein n=1 Tax=Bracon brevicornis TaxID=1563983 RepID=A0A6V7IM88_9HYME
MPNRTTASTECLPAPSGLQFDLGVIMCRWRLHCVTVGADMEKMYRQSLVNPDDIELQPIIWRDSDGIERHYQPRTVTYGDGCTPFIAL